MTLWHFTCRHRAERIGRRGLLTPHHHPIIEDSLVWLTDLAVPDPELLGLTSTFIACDRTEVRYRVTDPSVATPWVELRAQYDPRLVSQLEAFRAPHHWWVSRLEVPVVRA